MLLNWLDIRLARVGLIVALVAIFVLAVIPQQEVPASSGWDKLDHWLAFFTLSLLADRATAGRWYWARTMPLLIAYGIGIEVAQYFTPDRHSEVLDVVADSIGVFIYGGLRLLLMLRLPRTG